jgi:hypothetical protein
MKKIPTLFVREFEGHKVKRVTDQITPGCEEAFLHGIPTLKVDGACCAIFDGVFYKRYDAKNGKKPPEGAIPCCDPDPITGHWPHWVKVDPDKPEDKWFVQARMNTVILEDGTYEAVGPHFQGNPYKLDRDILWKHGVICIPILERTFDYIKRWFEVHNEEGIVFWLNGEPVCKIKGSDFGYPWNGKKKKE